MTTTNFKVREYVLNTSYIRGYPRATRNEEDDVLRIHVKRYTPVSGTRPEPYDVTFIAAHANGVGKELYEPLFDDLYEYSRKSKKFRIRGIWIADVAWQGQSAVLNEGKLGNDPNWLDHSRDLLLMINHFRQDMPRPLVGLGHSMGGCQITNLALMHPRLFTSVLLIDPVIQKHMERKGNMMPAHASTFRRDIWPSRETAAAAFLRNKFYQSWDPRVFDRWIKHGLRELPTEVHPTYPGKAGEPQSVAPVTLTTTKHQEVFSFLRMLNPDSKRDMDISRPSRDTHADAYGTTQPGIEFYRPEPLIVYSNLPYLRPSCLYISAEHSDLSVEGPRNERTALTGAGVGGSGGAAEGRVKDVLIKGAGHFVAFEKPAEVAQAIGQWLDVEIPRFRKVESTEKAAWARTPGRDKFTLSAARIEKTKAVSQAGARL